MTNIKIRSIETIDKIVQEVLVHTEEIEKEGVKKDIEISNKKYSANADFRGTGGIHNAKKIHVDIGGYEYPIKVVVFYAPHNLAAISHIIDKGRWSKEMRKLYENQEENVSKFPVPLGYGDTTPVTYYWSEYVGTPLIQILQNSDVKKLTSLLALTLGANYGTLEEILNVELQRNENYRKIDDLKFNADPKRVLKNYIDDCMRRLKKTSERFESLSDTERKAASTYKDSIDIATNQVESAKNELQNMPVAKEDSQCVLIHTDLMVLTNIIYDGAENGKVSYDGQIWFVDSPLQEGRSIEDAIGPKQIYYFIFKEQLKELEEANKSISDNSMRDGIYTSQTEIRQMLTYLESILKKEYKIGENPIDYQIENIVHMYFETQRIRSGLEAIIRGSKTAKDAPKTEDASSGKKTPQQTKIEDLNEPQVSN